jgi:hypothetical protein
MKTNKVKYEVNYDNIDKLEDIDVEFGLAKHAAGIAMSDEEFKAILDKTEREAEKTTVAIIHTNIICEKKLPWYKRFWNWLKKPFCKKKQNDLFENTSI